MNFDVLLFTVITYHFCLFFSSIAYFEFYEYSCISKLTHENIELLSVSLDYRITAPTCLLLPTRKQTKNSS